MAALLLVDDAPDDVLLVPVLVDEGAVKELCLELNELAIDDALLLRDDATLEALDDAAEVIEDALELRVELAPEAVLDPDSTDDKRDDATEEAELRIDDRALPLLLLLWPTAVEARAARTTMIWNFMVVGCWGELECKSY